MRILFMGTPFFALPSLRSLHERFELIGVVAQPDRPAGRGKKLTPPPTKVLAEGLGVVVHQPEKKEELEKLVFELSPQCIVVVAYGKILSKRILDVPEHGCINLHASLLPNYRGSAPIQRALMSGERTTGNTIMLMNEGMDTGKVLNQESLDIDEEDNLFSLTEKLSIRGAKLLVETLEEWFAGKIEPKEQDHSKATYAPPIKKEELRVCWKAQAKSVKDRVRGLYPDCYAYTEWEDRIKVLKVKVCYEPGEPGEILEKNRLLVACGEGSVEILELISPKGKRMSGEEFIRGYKVSMLY
ncbi:MAG: methionyl-tRNA formyltransferase [Aquificaceae bacterium]